MYLSPQDSWYVILCDKFRNERRGLGGAGASPRVKGVKKESHDTSSISMATEHNLSMDTGDEGGGGMHGDVEVCAVWLVGNKVI